ncbi:hypothetical protein CNMCM5793_001727 [Aspergillus hiratsukae]|uniref:Uncharacterized protein n=1 Tax=Aspergillus hiratsukae TaxID=1194566 RepID=A0A8H6QB22_9EURO|nr:hypothetical protein CNMCM5793_001727 [Aspergillus hiratsukae]KAF7169129.1 hypothetical protein CNMCM6106_004120 [Aspergillus hiratsukae]
MQVLKAVVIMQAKCVEHTLQCPGLSMQLWHFNRSSSSMNVGWLGRSHTPDIELENLPFGLELDESLLADIDACLALHNRVELAAAQASAEDDSDDIMAYECG